MLEYGKSGRKDRPGPRTERAPITERCAARRSTRCIRACSQGEYSVTVDRRGQPRPGLGHLRGLGEDPSTRSRTPARSRRRSFEVVPDTREVSAKTLRPDPGHPRGLGEDPRPDPGHPECMKRPRFRSDRPARTGSLPLFEVVADCAALQRYLFEVSPGASKVFAETSRVSGTGSKGLRRDPASVRDRIEGLRRDHADMGEPLAVLARGLANDVERSSHRAIHPPLS